MLYTDSWTLVLSCIVFVGSLCVSLRMLSIQIEYVHVVVCIPTPACVFTASFVCTLVYVCVCADGLNWIML